MARRAKIVCTLGPAVATSESILALVEAGMDVARLNFSHGTHEQHRAAYDMVRAASDVTGRAVAVLADLQGPKIRLGDFATGLTTWDKDEIVRITTDKILGTHDRVSTTYSGLIRDVSSGDRVLVDDGRVELHVIDVEGTDVVLRVIEGGPVSDHKGINLPDVMVSEPALTVKDAMDLRFALSMRADLIALSFVRKPEDIALVHAVMAEEGVRLPVLAKIEKPEAVDDLEAIVAAFDGLMVARGDLGVEMPLERVPVVQKVAVQLARDNAKPVIVATQMLESMISSSRPTRAEASDVANAVLDGADALMLSGETSVGEFPIESVQTMARVIDAVETGHGPQRIRPLGHDPRTQSGAIGRGAVEIATQLGAVAIVAFTMGGDTARRMARHHCEIPLYAFTPIAASRSQLAVSWGVETFLADTVGTFGEMVLQADQVLLASGRHRAGDIVVIVAGVPIATSGATNTIRVHRLGSLS